MAWRGQVRAGPIKPEVYQPEFDNARKLGLPITVHVASARKAVNQIEPLYKAKLMGKDVQLIHTLSANAAELDMIKESGSSVSVSPGSELRIGYGYPQISEMLAKGIPLGISVDTSALTGSSNLFAVLKLARDSENARAESETKMSARKALELGTIAGARSMGIDDKVGSLKPGKRADPDRDRHQCAQHGGGDRSGPSGAGVHRAGNRRYRGGRRPDPQARRQARGGRYAQGGRRGARGARGCPASERNGGEGN